MFCYDAAYEQKIIGSILTCIFTPFLLNFPAISSEMLLFYLRVLGILFENSENEKFFSFLFLFIYSR